MRKQKDTNPAERTRLAIGNSASMAMIYVPVIFIVLVIVYNIIAPEKIYLPSAENIILFGGLVWVITTIRNSYAKSICYFWAIWFLLGSISLFAQNQISKGLNYNFDPSSANNYYLCCVWAAVLAIKGLELSVAILAPAKPEPLARGSNAVTWSILLAFPFLYAVSIVAATGDIPLFSGRNVSAEMYEVEYGPLHSFGVLVTVASIMLWEKMSSRSSFAHRRPIRYMSAVILCIFLVIAAMDGRRAMAIFALFGIILFSSAQPGRLAQRVQVVMVAAFALLGYLVAASVRSGAESLSAFANIWGPLSGIGTEYRDFLYGFVRLNRLQVLGNGYDWLGSTFATLVPGRLLSVFGLDKSVLTQMDSARVLMEFWNVKLGIRIGLPGELWFAFGWWGVPAFAAFAIIVYVVALMALRTTHFIYRAVLLALLGIFATAVLGQSTVTFGLILPLIYLSIFVMIVELLTRPRRSGARRVDGS